MRGSIETIAGLISGGHGEGVSEVRFETGFSVIIIVYHAVTCRGIYSPNGTGLFPNFFFRSRDNGNLKNLNS